MQDSFITKYFVCLCDCLVGLRAKQIGRIFLRFFLWPVIPEGWIASSPLYLFGCSNVSNSKFIAVPQDYPGLRVVRRVAELINWSRHVQHMKHKADLQQTEIKPV